MSAFWVGKKNLESQKFEFEEYFDREQEAFNVFASFLSPQNLVYLAERGTYEEHGEEKTDWITYLWSIAADSYMNGRPEGRGNGWVWGNGKAREQHVVNYKPVADVPKA